MKVLSIIPRLNQPLDIGFFIEEQTGLIVTNTMWREADFVYTKGHYLNSPHRMLVHKNTFGPHGWMVPSQFAEFYAPEFTPEHV